MRELLAELTAAFDRRLACVYCAVVETRGSTPQKAGAAMLVYPDGTQAGTLGGGCVEAEVKRRALHALGENAGPAVHTFCLDDDYGWDDGLICGGRMAILAHRLAAEVGFDVWVLDDRDRYAGPERFPTASRRLVGDIGTTLRDLAPTLTPGVFALILTRGHSHDEEALYHLAGTACGYVGMIGSKRKIRMIFDDLIAKGIPQEALERVHAPLGYNIGSQTVPEIAVSIVAELIACRNLGTGDAARQSWGRPT